MTLQPGSKVGPYEILAPAGAGGMGEVYRARDTRLDRVVAIKTLPAHLAGDAELRERFEREARAVAALNHPNICMLFDVGDQDGVHFLVMEYVEGETLATRLARGPLPLDQALKVGAEIAGALDKAHRQGIVHRDLKPGNIMLTKSGAKLLDFGLARLKQPSHTPAFSSSSMLPTEASAITAQGAIIGTLQYMAPEQLEGADSDSRTDIFALGAVFYEMLTGRRAFEGKSQVSLIGSILEREPQAVSGIVAGIPPVLENVVTRCLAKSPDDRWQSAGDVAAQLQWIAASLASGATTSQDTQPAARSFIVPFSSTRWWKVAALLFLLVSLALAGMILLRAPQPAAPLVQFQIPAPPQQSFLSSLNANTAYAGGSISPDGRLIAFSAADSSGQTRLWVRSVDSVTARVLPGTEEAGLPFWSPDSRFIGFGAQGKLKKIDVTGGQPLVLCEASALRGGAWNEEGVIVFASTANSGLFRVAAAGGEPVELIPVVAPQTSLRAPAFLPDNNHFIYSAVGGQGEHEIFAAALDKPESRKPLLKANSIALYSRAGYLIFPRAGVLFAQAFDVDELELKGEPVRIAEPVASGSNWLAASVSNAGTLIYRTGAPAIGPFQLQWVDRSGKPAEVSGMPGTYMGVDLSRDGKKLAVHRHEDNGGDIWVLDSAQSPMSRLTFDPARHNASPVWSPDGSSVAYNSVSDGKQGIYRRPANGTGEEETLVAPSAGVGMPASWSPDGKYLVYEQNSKGTGPDIWAIPLTGDRKPIPLVTAPGVQGLPQVSPDGHWLAYVSNESGGYELYVTTFPSAKGRWQITSNGASSMSVRWRGDNRELYYVREGQTRDLMALPINPEGNTLRWGTPARLFTPEYAAIPEPSGTAFHDFVVSPDGQRFLFPRPEESVTEASKQPLTVVLNWTRLLQP